MGYSARSLLSINYCKNILRLADIADRVRNVCSASLAHSGVIHYFQSSTWSLGCPGHANEFACRMD